MVECFLPQPKVHNTLILADPSKCKAFVGQGRDKENMYFTYVLRCINYKTNKVQFYTGSTENLPNRIEDHTSKSVNTTMKFDKIELVYYEACLSKTDALKREKQLKTGFGRGYIKKSIENYLKSLRD